MFLGENDLLLSVLTRYIYIYILFFLRQEAVTFVPFWGKWVGQIKQNLSNKLWYAQKMDSHTPAEEQHCSTLSQKEVDKQILPSWWRKIWMLELSVL